MNPAPPFPDRRRRFLRPLRWVVFGVLLAVVLVRWLPRLAGSAETAPAWATMPEFFLPSPLDWARLPEVAESRFPLGNALGAFAYNARGFRIDRHLGDDWNGIGGGATDAGDPVHPIAPGRVLLVRPAGLSDDEWGGVVVVGHREDDGRLVQSFYGHLDAIRVIRGQRVHPGRALGTVGDANGRYRPHLHLEVRCGPVVSPGVGYALTGLDREDPTRWIESRLPAPPVVLRVPGPGISRTPAPLRADPAPPDATGDAGVGEEKGAGGLRQ